MVVLTIIPLVPRLCTIARFFFAFALPIPGKRVNSRSCEVTGQLRGNKKDAHTTTGESAPAAAAAAAAVYRRRPSTSYNTVDDSDNQQGIRRPWTASATTSPIKRYMGPTGSSMRREGTAVRRPRQGRGRDFCSGGWLDDTEEACAPREGGGVLWGQPQRVRISRRRVGTLV